VQAGTAPVKTHLAKDFKGAGRWDPSDLARGVDPGTVQAWMGDASIATTNLYLHHLGTRGTPGARIWGASE
jgi:hypothetical protein